MGAKTAKLLEEALGVKLVGELAETPSTALRHVFGARGDLLRLWARGEDDDPVHGPEPPKSIGRETTFDEDSDDLAFLLPLLRQLTERVGADLRREGKKARRVSVRVRYHDFQTVSHQTTLKQPVSHDQGIYDAGASILMRTLKQRKAKVRLVGISSIGFRAGCGSSVPLRASGQEALRPILRHRQGQGQVRLRFHPDGGRPPTGRQQTRRPPRLGLAGSTPIFLARKYARIPFG